MHTDLLFHALADHAVFPNVPSSFGAFARRLYPQGFVHVVKATSLDAKKASHGRGLTRISRNSDKEAAWPPTTFTTGGFGASGRMMLGGSCAIELAQAALSTLFRQSDRQNSGPVFDSPARDFVKLRRAAAIALGVGW